MKSYILLIALLINFNTTKAQQDYQLSNILSLTPHKVNLIKKTQATLKRSAYSPSALRFNVNNQTAANKLKLDSILTYSEMQKVVTHKEEYQYNNSGQETTQISYFINDTTNALENSSKSEKIYDAKSRLIRYISYDGFKQNWIFVSKFEYAYDISDHVTSYIQFQWNPLNSSWEPSSKSILKYDAKYYVIQVIDSIYDVPKKKWNLNYKTEIINNQMGQATTVIYSNWNQSFKQWEYAERDEFIYNLNGRQISFVSYFWDETTSDWVYFAKFLANYNAANKLVQDSSYSWDGNQWVGDLNSNYTFDANGNMISSTIQNWDENTNQWKFLVKDECTYDNAYSFQDILLPERVGLDQELYFNHKIDKQRYFIKNSGNFVNDETYTYYYSKINLTDVENNNLVNYQIYPNPAHDCFKFSGDLSKTLELQILSLDGTILYSKIINSDLQVSTDPFPSGLYFYRLKDGKHHIETGKLIIQK